MKKMILALALCFPAFAGAQDMAMNVSNKAVTATDATGTDAADSKPAAEFVFHTYGDIPVAKTAFEEEHYLGGKVSEKWNTFIANYTNEYSVSVGLSSSGYEFVKPAVYNAVKRANKYVKKALKKNQMSRAEAVSKMSHVLDCANVICFESDTKKFEEAAKDAKTGEAVLELFGKVKLVN